MDATSVSPRTASPGSVMLRDALTGLWLPGALIATVVVMMVLQNLIGPSSVIEETLGMALLFGVGTLCMGAGGAQWWRRMRALTGVSAPRHVTIVAAIAHVALTLGAIIVLGRLEGYLVEEGHAPLPLHNLFTILFVPAVAICAGALCAAVGGMLGGPAFAWRMAMPGGLAAGTAFLCLNIAQDLLGRRVGGPNAAQTATMITVTLLSNLGAAMAMSAAIAPVLRRWQGEQACLTQSRS